MNSTSVSHVALPKALPAGAPSGALRVFKLLERLPHGSLDLQLPDGSAAHFPAAVCGEGGPAQPRASMRLHNWRVIERTLKSGDIGFAESYIEGDWTTSDLQSLLALFIANRDHIEGLVYGSWWGGLLHRLKHMLNRNSRRGSAKNIHAHYDLGNDFYRLWLDHSMSYSAAWFDGRPEQPLQLAQEAKMRRALSEVGAAPGQRVLEIGCGWGALAELAVREFGTHVTGVTLSHEQLAWAQARIAKLGLMDRCDLRMQDYRELSAAHGHAPFDAVVSIEMFEAVGYEYWNDYFRALQGCLKLGGRACIQTITIRDDLFPRYLRSTDFIQQYVFPGGLLPSPSAFEAQAHRGGFAVERRLSFGGDYAETLRRWREAFLQREPQLRAQGFDTRFLRIWDFYLAYCEAAFAMGNTDVVQYTLRRVR